MIRIENLAAVASPEQMHFIIEGMRNPMNSWDKSDSEYYAEAEDEYGRQEKSDFWLGENDHKLMCKLSKAGKDHRKFMRMMPVYVRITAPLYWWKEFDTYKIGTVTNSCSTMHKITAKEFTLDDFSTEHLITCSLEILNKTIDILNEFREWYAKHDYIINDKNKLFSKEITCKKDIWWQIIQLLPSCYNQTRNVMMNYETLANIYESRKDHKLDEWRNFCKFIERLPYSELICNTTVSTDKSLKWNGNEPVKCTRCNGRGIVMIGPPHIKGVKTCPVCNGTGTIAQLKGEK